MVRKKSCMFWATAALTGLISLAYLTHAKAETYILHTYTIQEGDTLWDIAGGDNEKIKAIMHINGLDKDDTYRLQPGQKLQIPEDIHKGFLGLGTISSKSIANIKQANLETGKKRAEKGTRTEKATYPRKLVDYAIDPNVFDLTKAYHPSDVFEESDFMTAIRTAFIEFKYRQKEEVRAGIYLFLNRCQDRRERFRDTMLATSSRIKNGKRVSSFDFSCYNPWDASYQSLKDPFLDGKRNLTENEKRTREKNQKEWLRIANIVKKVFENPDGPDPSKGADHFCHRAVESTWLPYWAKGETPTVIFRSNGTECLMYDLY